MRSRLFNLIQVVCLSLVLILSILPYPVNAVADPTSVSIVSTKVFQNVFATGDQLFFVEYDVAYGVDPTEHAHDTYLMQIFDGATLKAQKALSYYDLHIVALYMNSTQTTVVWGSAITIKITGNPSVFFPSGTPSYSRLLASTDWIEDVPTNSTHTYLGTYVLGIAQDLEDNWPVDPTTGLPLIYLLSADNLLSSAGALIFGECIPGLETVCPEIYETSTTSVTFTPATNQQNGALQTSANLLTGARLQGVINGLATWTGASASMVGIFGLIIGMLILLGRVFTATGSSTIAVVASIPVLFIGAAIGIIPFALLWALIIVVVLLFGITFILARLA